MFKHAINSNANPACLLACKMHDAVGTKLDIFWDDDNAWYPAVVVEYIEATCSHRVVYPDENDASEKLCLWDPTLKIKIK